MSLRPKTIPPAPREAKLTINEVRNMLQARPPQATPNTEPSEAEMVRTLQRKGYTVSAPSSGQRRTTHNNNNNNNTAGDWGFN